MPNFPTGQSFLSQLDLAEVSYGADELKAGQTGDTLSDALLAAVGNDLMGLPSAAISDIAARFEVVASTSDPDFIALRDGLGGGPVDLGYEGVILRDVITGEYVLSSAGVNEQFPSPFNNTLDQDLFEFEIPTRNTGFNDFQLWELQVFMDYASFLEASAGRTLTQIDAVGHSGGFQVNLMMMLSSHLSGQPHLFKSVVGFSGFYPEKNPIRGNSLLIEEFRRSSGDSILNCFRVERRIG